MASITTLGIVLRHADYKENDRMLTLLSPTMGRVDALCRGCKRPQSPLLSCSEWFAMGEFVLYSGHSKLTVTSCQLQDSFYPLRTDYELLRYATYILSVCEASAQPGEGAVELFTLLTRSLSRLAYKKMEPRSVCAAFLLLYSALSGYRPRLHHCIQCEKLLEENRGYLMDVNAGGLICATCATSLSGGIPTRADQIFWMQDVLRVGIENTSALPESAPFALLRTYVERRLDRVLPSGRGL